MVVQRIELTLTIFQDRDISAVVRNPRKDAEPQRRDSESQLKRSSSCTDMRHIDVHPTPDPSPMENPTNDTAQKASVERDTGSGENPTSTNPPVASKSSKDCIQYSEIVANRPRKDSKMNDMPSRQAPGRHAGLGGEEVDRIWRKKYSRKKKELEMDRQAALHDSAQLRADNAHLREELLSLQAQLDRLQNAHVKAVNSSGAGLDPISDQAFISKLNNLHAEVNSYCRRVFRGIKIEIRDENIDRWVKSEHRCRRQLDSYGFTVGNILEVILWSYWEAMYNNSWFFWDTEKHFTPTDVTEKYVRNGGRLSKKI